MLALPCLIERLPLRRVVLILICTRSAEHRFSERKRQDRSIAAVLDVELPTASVIAVSDAVVDDLSRGLQSLFAHSVGVRQLYAFRIDHIRVVIPEIEEEKRHLASAMNELRPQACGYGPKRIVI